jgi:parvulin-like peptidyl-prolyl isomerase
VRVAELLLAGLALGAIASARAGDTAPVSTASPTVPKDAWAIVDSSVITKADVDRRAKLLALLVGAPDIPPYAVLQTLVTERAIVSHLDHEGIGPGSVTRAEVDAARRELEAGAARASGPDLEKRIAAAGLEAEFDIQLRASVALKKRVEGEATDAALRETFEKRKLLLCDGEIRARSLLVAVRDSDALALARAQQLLSATKPDGSNMDRLCRTVSDDPNAPLTGGDLDWFSPRATWVPPEVVRACFERATTGLVPQPIKAHDGYHIVYITGTRVLGDATFEAKRELVKNLFLAEHAAALIKSWHDEAKVTFAPDAPKEP